MDSKEISEIVVRAADSKRAHDIVVLDMEKVSLMADYFVIADANSNRQVKAIADEIVDQVQASDVHVYSVSGKETANWILIDLGDVVVHVFQKDTRDFYNLEKLWSDAPLVNIASWVEA
ncbi:ribosome silencing factor [Lentilactobacillus parafarraginis]|jgi:ribosome-associated protein|uniref:Ribosomal silencing factor RsfS n=2 Tax=Lentilactobacillus parafarraginis TaxID=390842 RepID=A0A0R1YT83_9LACO|nr:ribosome silencing factor [Lentilactobacillus parafarraginis]KRM43972.1 Iojap family protein [Lentilactobacillus parafarraginis DSM 18390 = JCM 14109]TLQ20600.1 ribosome silencing factor [Lentilactobacillus parafarraginis]